jgi:hypothetical protein
MTVESDPYRAIAAHLPNEVRLGGALITMVEPHRGFEHQYNRWYEDDHFYAGAMVGPWVFAGRRWVATRDLQQLRYPVDSPIAQPVTAGCYISTYWQSAGHHDDAVRWGETAMGQNLYPQGRGFTERTHVYTAVSTYEFGVIRDAGTPMRPEHALDHPFRGLVVEALDPGDTPRGELIGWLRDDFAPGTLAGSPIAQCLGFFPGSRPPSNIPGVPEAPNQGRLITLLWFLDVDPRQCWSHFLGHGETIAREGRTELQLAAPFIPTIPGTETYEDELR